MLAQRLSTNLRSATCGVSRLASINTSATASVYIGDDKPEKAPRKLKEWLKPPPMEESTLLGSLQGPRDVKATGKPFRVLRKRLPLGPGELRQWVEAKQLEYAKYGQRFVSERHEILGCDLAAAHFLVFRDGKVKFLGQDEWISKDETGLNKKLPVHYDPYWQLTHIDASGLQLYYEGLANFINLGQVKWASFKGNSQFDDWCMDKIIAQLPKLEYLDVSECKKLSERGLGAIYRLFNLKTLIVTDWEKLPSFELTCVMLEDLNADLKIEIKEPAQKEEKQ